MDEPTGISYYDQATGMVRRSIFNEKTLAGFLQNEWVGGTIYFFVYEEN